MSFDWISFLIGFAAGLGICAISSGIVCVIVSVRQKLEKLIEYKAKILSDSLYMEKLGQYIKKEIRE